MSYRFSAALQAAVYRQLIADPEISELVGDAIYDAPPEPAAATLLNHVTLGEERVRPFDTMTSQGSVHDFTVSVHSGQDGFDGAKRVAGAVCAALVDAPLALEHGRLVATRFLRARAERGASPEKRRITMMFRAVVDQDD